MAMNRSSALQDCDLGMGTGEKGVARTRMTPQVILSLLLYYPVLSFPLSLREELEFWIWNSVLNTRKPLDTAMEHAHSEN